MRKQKRGFGTTLREQPSLEQVAGNGLLHRRALLSGSVAFAGALTASSDLPAPLPSRSTNRNGALRPATSRRRCKSPRISKTKSCAP